jgi:hypothetical protein
VKEMEVKMATVEMKLLQAAEELYTLKEYSTHPTNEMINKLEVKYKARFDSYETRIFQM